jgi:hypothetical protein
LVFPGLIEVAFFHGNRGRRVLGEGLGGETGESDKELGDCLHQGRENGGEEGCMGKGDEVSGAG